ncbi:kinase-like protein [Trametes polyzona]|nr:kinase-like protein [Trametes polyzona]
MSSTSDIPNSRFPSLDAVKSFIKREKTLASSHHVTVVEVDDVVIKYGPRVYKSEALAMQLVRETTTVPLPQVLSYFTEVLDGAKDRCGYLIMEKVPGVLLAQALPNLSDKACDEIASQLRTHLSSLRSIKSDGKWGIVGRNGVFHGGQFHYLHPPRTEEQHLYGNPCRATSAKDVYDYFAKAAADLNGGWPASIPKDPPEIDFARPAVFSHGDLVPENIMVDEASGAITSIIDWEHAGWYPYFWDDTIASLRLSAYQSAPAVSRGWDRIRRGAISNAAEEAAVKAFSVVHFSAVFHGEEEYRQRPCPCCF